MKPQVIEESTKLRFIVPVAGIENSTTEQTEDELLEHYSTESRRLYSHTIEGFISLGRCLIEAKEKLSGPGWKTFTSTDRCPVSYTVATRYMKIAENPNITDPANWISLPITWNVLYEISILTDEQFNDGMRQQTITREARIDDIRILAGKPPHSATRRQITQEEIQQPVPDSEEIDNLAALFAPRPNIQAFRQETLPPVTDETGDLAKCALVIRDIQTPQEGVTNSVCGPHQLIIQIPCAPIETVEALKHGIVTLLEQLSVTNVTIETK
jgi:hypothetical protein